MSQQDTDDRCDIESLIQSSSWRTALAMVQRQVHPSDPSVESDDIAQECFLGLHQASRSYDPSNGASLLTYARPWIVQRARRIARNCAIGIPIRFRDSYASRPDAMLRTVQYSDDIASSAPDAAPTPDEQVEQIESYRELLNRLRSVLSEEQHMALTLYAEGWSMDDIADLLQRTPGQVKGLIRMARATARRTLAPRNPAADASLPPSNA